MGCRPFDRPLEVEHEHTSSSVTLDSWNSFAWIGRMDMAETNANRLGRDCKSVCN